MAVKYISQKGNGNISTTKEISDKYSLSFDLMAKILQQLCKSKILNSIQGIKGGYSLSRNAEEISILDVIKSVEKSYKIADCFNEDITLKTCTHENCCQIKEPLLKVQLEIDNLFSKTSIASI
ncbi:MAG: Rrf2 family transcriptional regulator [Ignavibacteriaceae bacterium]|nr:Rrf2 family transcriptional regulator [Ignavibacteriaceae bacterium]